MTYQTDPADKTKKVVDPEYRKLDGQVRKVAGTLGRLTRKFGRMVLDQDSGMGKIVDYEIKKGELKEKIDKLSQDLGELKEKRKNTGKHTTLEQLSDEERFHQLEPVRKM